VECAQRKQLWNMMRMGWVGVISFTVFSYQHTNTFRNKSRNNVEMCVRLRWIGVREHVCVLCESCVCVSECVGEWMDKLCDTCLMVKRNVHIILYKWFVGRWHLGEVLHLLYTQSTKAVSTWWTTTHKQCTRSYYIINKQRLYKCVAELSTQQNLSSSFLVDSDEVEKEEEEEEKKWQMKWLIFSVYMFMFVKMEILSNAILCTVVCGMRITKQM
jgi:hypothetical protein